MAISKAVKAAIRALTLLDIDITKTYLLERRIRNLAARIPGGPLDYEMWDQEIACDGRSVPVRIFSPPGGRNVSKAFLFFHGGGWVTGNIDTYTRMCAALSLHTGRIVVSVDYRLAPEHRFPAGLMDCYAVARRIYQHGLMACRSEDVILIGDSAGGNLAAAVSLMARDRGEFMPPGQILLYPVTASDHSETSQFPSIRENGHDYLLTSRRVQHMIEMYKREDEDLESPYFAPLCAGDFSRQPRTLVLTAEYDPLRDEGEAYGEKLREAGGEVQVVRLQDALHGFMVLPPRFEHVQKAYETIHEFLQRG